MASRKTEPRLVATVPDTIDITLLRPHDIVPHRTNLLIALGVFIVTLAVYMLTQALSLSFWDAGEYITSSSILGVPHPPGNPFYIILGRVFCILGFGLSHATIVNFVSGLMSAMAVALLYLITTKLVSMFEKNPLLIVFTGLLAAFYCAFSYTYWTNAIEAEVYAGLALTLNLVMYLTLVWVQKQRDFSHQNLLLLIVYIFFLGFCIHQTSLQIAPAVLFIAVYPMLLKHIKTFNFWMRTGIYFIILIAMYAIIDPIGKGIRLPDLSKLFMFVAVVGLIMWHMRDKVKGRTWWLALIFLLLGLTPHIYLMVRAAQRPFMNEGIPSNLKMFGDYVLRRQYGVTSFFQRRFLIEPHGQNTPFMIGLFGQFRQFLEYFGWQFFHAETLSRWFSTPAQVFRFLGNLVMVGAGVGGLVVHFRRNRHSWAYLAMLFFWSSLAMVAVMNISHAEPRPRDYFYVNAYYLWGVWMAIGFVALVRQALNYRKALGYAVAALMTLLCVLNAASMWHIHDRTREVVALDYGQNFLNSLEENAIVFTNGDNDTFPLWYVQAVADPLAHENIWPARNIYPTEHTNQIIFEALEYKISECNGIRLDVTIANLSLLNTGWYIRQLRDKEGIEFNIADSLITPDVFGTVLAQQRIRRDLRISERSPAGHLRTNVIPVNTILNTADLATLRLVKDNWGKRPIYFAVTIPDGVIRRLGLEPFLRNEGMVDRLVAQPGQDADIERLLANIDEIYSYRGIGDDSVFKDDNSTRLLGNYGHAYIIVASKHFLDIGDYDNAIYYMEEGLKFVKDNERLLPGLAQIYMRADRPDEAHEIARRAIEYSDRDLVALYLELSQTYTDLGQPDKGIEVIEEAVAMQPDNATLQVQCGYVYLDNEDPETAFERFNEAVRLKPHDNSLPQILFNATLEAGRYDLGIAALQSIRVMRNAPAADDASDQISRFIRQLERLQTTADSILPE
ncbi:MAG: DUF2723 domain-containing protein [Candidatus Cloacimonetes bacterium]|nr:DUF2723 domain-containing protein [Candidatus Cloacimonadota bacterium]